MGVRYKVGGERGRRKGGRGMVVRLGAPLPSFLLHMPLKLNGVEEARAPQPIPPSILLLGRSLPHFPQTSTLVVHRCQLNLLLRIAGKGRDNS